MTRKGNSSMKLTLRVTILAIAALFAVTGAAVAASPQEIYRDAADGSIDGKYKLSDLRAADAAISADQREYILWDEVYAAAIARVSSPNAPKPKIVKPVDANGNGAIDPDERAQAAAKTRELNKKLFKIYKKPGASAAATETEADETDSVAVASASDSDDDGDGLSWPLIVFIAAIIVIGLVGAWRVIALRNKPESSTKPNERDTKRDPRDNDTNADPRG